jgi:MFS transporter, DHA2 family, multidrug resistance protein
MASAPAASAAGWPVDPGSGVGRSLSPGVGGLITGCPRIWVTLISFGCVYTPLTSVVLKTLPKGRLSMGSGLDGIHRGFGSAFGIAVGSTVLELRTLTHLMGLGEQHDVSALSVREASGEMAHLLAGAGELGGAATAKALATLRERLLRHAELAAYQDTFLLLCAITLLALLPAMLSRETREGFGKQSSG